MPTFDPRIDAYIAKSAEFAQPILTHLRAVVHGACPEVEETIKWSMPSFTYHGLLCNMAAFKAHCAFGFWKGSLLMDASDARTTEAMGQFGRITSIKDLPSKKALTAMVKQAMQLNVDDVKVPARAKPAASRTVKTPDYLAAKLKQNKAARATFDAFPPSCKREYVEWLEEAKTEPTRLRRLAQTIEWLAEGKRRNWKYEKC